MKEYRSEKKLVKMNTNVQQRSKEQNNGFLIKKNITKNKTDKS